MNQEQYTMDSNGGITTDDNNINRDDNNNDGENTDSRVDARFSPKKIFVGGLPHNITTEEFRGFFETFGAIKEAVVILHRVTKRPRGFGFVTFESEETVATVLKKKHYRLNNCDVEVKRAERKIVNQGFDSYTPRSGYLYCNFYCPIWCPNGPCMVCAYRGVLFPAYPIYNAQYLGNHQFYTGGEEYTNGLSCSSSHEIGECSSRNNSSADYGGEAAEQLMRPMNNVENKLAST